MNHNILVLGSNGQLGSEFKELSILYKDYNFFFTCKDELNIADTKSILAFVNKHKITTMINCAGYTAVDKAESDVELAMSINHLAVESLAYIAKNNSISLIHISTDYVFDGCNYKPYIETDTTYPCSVYGQSKRDGEKAILKINPKKSIIIRTSWLYSSYGANFVKTMLRLGQEREALGVVCDQIGTPTYARDLAKAILDILSKISNEKVTIYHYSNEGALSWYDFAKEIMKMSMLSCKVNPIETYQYPTPAKRPHFSILSKSKIKSDFHLEIPYWKDSLEACLKKMSVRQ